MWRGTARSFAAQTPSFLHILNRTRLPPMKHWFNNARIRTKILVCAIAIVLIVILMSGGVYAGIAASQARDQLLEHANAIVMSTDALQVHLTNIELAYRSYLLTGDKVWLKSYDAYN